MDDKVRNMLGAGFASDLFETIKAAKGAEGEKAFRHTMYEGTDGMVAFCALYPKADVLRFPGVNQEFSAKLKTFNAIGVITNMRDRLEYFTLGGLNKPFTSLQSPQEVADVLDPGLVAAFMAAYFKVRGLDMDLEAMSYDEFLKAVEAHVMQTTPLSVLNNISKNMEN